jgi:hypothetical protein
MRRVVALTALVLTGVAANALAGTFDPADGPYKGRTGQGAAVYFGVSARTVVNPRYTVVWGSCGRMTAHFPSASAVVDANQHFSIDTGQTVLRGTFIGPRRVEGTVIFRRHPLAGCPRTAVHYSAHHR